MSRTLILTQTPRASASWRASVMEIRDALEGIFMARLYVAHVALSGKRVYSGEDRKTVAPEKLQRLFRPCYREARKKVKIK